MTYLDDLLAGADKYFKINLFNTVSGIRSVWMIGTADSRGRKNLGLFNSVVHIGANPPLLGVVFRPESVRRHTLENIRSTGFFTFNSINQAILDLAHKTSLKYSDQEDEFDILGFTPFYFPNHTTPAVEDSPLKILLKRKEEHLIEANKTVFVVGEIINLAVDNSSAVDENGCIRHDLLNHAAISGLNDYYCCQFLKSKWDQKKGSLPKNGNS
ncbi:flavin reductase family protein [Schleiferia thermophila]|uniref:Flavin reductase (DIM6/NTAB) family NADH-FMN oxidoreductase RutF n=1 Tax=Schleiferia thermophila TaxID=884107 RepID=A0A369A7C3_9FLAO|nr:flavin reductase [Schleiferia thermophila]RCX05250.1 flavin reductase (DIM6/NTAB) family NADH-FMN oxidoreductase RutF [Schleiferia thermophila]GCD79240.1 flavin oxidoreductase [Schleiferia thermophila]